ncbi:hypothetical protein [Agarivorans gilvus]|uniref:Solute-binding protein family 3/N-terminal domain-containing protein n=1 Tax=Agarivorans gilvus TaxID=680279 RepID=A0ABQ1I4C6_9ALTE|nr:hypothetical protein [Agarivorans gilvus]GGB11061.1 hypothetical protein GCM10007414_25640 [Agarivorans gilvus]
MNSYIVCFLLLIFNISKAEELTLPVAGDIGTYELYLALVEEKGGDPFKINNYHSTYSTRASVSLLLLVQALKAGGLKFNIEFLPTPSSARSIRLVKSGSAVLYQADIWHADFDDSTYMTQAVVRSGVFEKGFYVKSESPYLNKELDQDQLKNLTVAVEKTWHMDIAQLEQAGFKHVSKVSKSGTMLDMLQRGRVDAVFWEFSERRDLAIFHKKYQFLPIPRFKLSFRQGRHFMVSKQHPLGQKVYLALEHGIAALWSSGIVRKALTQAGLYNPEVSNWQDLSEETPPPQTPNFPLFKEPGKISTR